MTFSPAVGRGCVLAFVFLFPLLLFWNTASHRYGFRDDYSILRETNEEPGKILRVCAGMGRPLYGLLIENSFGRLDRLEDLKWMRRLGAVWLGLTAALLCGALRAQGWDDSSSVLVALLFSCLPGLQMLVSWAIGWPPIFAFAVAVAGYCCGEKAIDATAGKTRFAWWLAALLLVAGSTLTYQASVLFYLVPLAGGLFERWGRGGREIAAWLLRHGVTFGCGLGLALAVILQLFANGGIEMSSRVAVSPSVSETLDWFCRFPLPNALALFALEGNGPSAAAYTATIFLVVTLLLAGLVITWREHGQVRGAMAAGAMLLLPVAAYGVNLLSTERLPSYRTLVPLSALVLVLVTASLRAVAGRRITLVVLGATLLVATWTAHRQAFDLIALPQSRELELMESAASQLDALKRSRVFIILPVLAEAPASLRVGDEFGSLSTNSDWVAKEIWAAAVKERFGNTAISYECEAGETLPRDQAYDVVVDMRQLRNFQRR